MKASPNINGIQEINTGGKKINNRINIINKKISTDSYADSLAHKSNNFQNYLPSKNDNNNPNNDQANNNNMNTSNTVDYNIVDPSTIKELEKSKKEIH